MQYPGTPLLPSIKQKFPLGNDELIAAIGEYRDKQAGDDKHALLDSLGPLSSIFDKLGCDEHNGLGADEEETDFADRIAVYGTNTNPPVPFKSFFLLFWSALTDTTIMVLCVAATISLVLGCVLPEPGHEETAWIEGIAIFIAVLIVAVVTATNEYSKAKQFRALNAVKNDKPVKVLRVGAQREISIYSVLVGDIVQLTTGDVVPADGLCCQSFGLTLDESAMTGESKELKKTPGSGIMMGGTLVTAGTGSMLVFCVGVNSEWGRMMSKLQKEPEPTPLQNKLEEVATTIGKAGLTVAVVTFAALLIIWGVTKVNSNGWNISYLADVVQFFIIAVTIVVVAVPEGLPLAVTIALAYSMKKMMIEKNLVRHLDACETMGGVTQICSDKTGTLTTNQMEVIQAFVGETFLPEHHLTISSTTVLSVVSQLIIANTTAVLEARKEAMQKAEEVSRELKTPVSPKTPKQVIVLPVSKASEEMRFPWKVVGSKTEGALLLWARKSLNVPDCAKARRGLKIERIWLFDAVRKSMCVAVETGDCQRIYVKGAADVVLDKCTRRLNANGALVAMDMTFDRIVREATSQMARTGLRTLLLAYKEVPSHTTYDDESPAPESELIFVGVVGIKDPLREEVKPAVVRCKEAGVVVRMVTGDHLDTAKFIATEAGLLDLNAGEIAMEGSKFRMLTRNEMNAILPKLRVLARSSPTDKHLLVTRLRQLGEVVAVTGDGTNDAPALKAADVGLAMGIAGTEVAKEAAAIIIMDDNFASIVSAIKWGRGVYDNIRKFLQFQLTVNVVALVVAFISAVSQRGTPLTAVQLLWVNLIMDSLAALALGTEEPSEDVLLRKPYGRHDPLISFVMWRNILGHSIYQVTILFGILYLGPYMWTRMADGSTAHYTMVFNSFVMCQVFNELNARKCNGGEHNIFAGVQKSPIFVFIVLGTIGVQILLVTFATSFISTAPLTISEWFACIGIGAFELVIGFVLRFVPTKRPAYTQTEEQHEEVKDPFPEDSDDDDSDGLLDGTPQQHQRRGSVKSNTRMGLSPYMRRDEDGIETIPLTVVTPNMTPAVTPQSPVMSANDRETAALAALSASVDPRALLTPAVFGGGPPAMGTGSNRVAPARVPSRPVSRSMISADIQEQA
eukprot:TRINITY_DN2382_c0_g1_i1.p1 TRINITY_DN2382_c0_g1~~TRINITY_DN2382_c0_g1_i1.p1  ORF type:complete len:1134 (+),score=253.49 TRINITY_DN2382_c0_g1_i1:140-3541(+)